MSVSDAEDLQKTLLWARLVPVVLLFLLYIGDMTTDIAAAAQLYSTGDIWGSCVCAALILVPILVYCVYESIRIIMRQRCSSKRALICLAQLLFCPIFVILRFAERIFWLVETLLVKNTTEIELAVQRAYEPRRIEIYLFIRPILQSVPQSLLQMFLMVYIGKVEIRLIQALSMLTSLLSFSVIAATYQRFESQEETVMPWIYKKIKLAPEIYPITELKSDTKPALSTELRSLLRQQTSLQEVSKVSSDLNFTKDDPKMSQTLPRKFRYANTTMVTDSGNRNVKQTTESVRTETNPPDVIQIHKNEGSPAPPIPPRNSENIAPARPPSRHIPKSDVDNIEVCDTSAGTRVSFLRHSYAEPSRISYNDNRRSSYHYLQASVSGSSNRSSDIKIITAPDFEAPAPPIPKKVDPLNVALPTRKKGQKYVNSDNPISYFVLLLKWFLFLGSRMIALGGLFALKHHSLIIMLTTLGCIIAHISIMFVIIRVNCNEKTSCWWKELLASLSSLICLLELGIKFEKYTRIMVIYWPLCFIENVVASFVSYRPHQIDKIDEWWYAYLFYTTISTYLLSVACMLFNTYVIIPRTYVIYDQ